MCRIKSVFCLWWVCFLLNRSSVTLREEWQPWLASAGRVRGEANLRAFYTPTPTDPPTHRYLHACQNTHVQPENDPPPRVKVNNKRFTAFFWNISFLSLPEKCKSKLYIWGRTERKLQTGKCQELKTRLSTTELGICFRKTPNWHKFLWKVGCKLNEQVQCCV